MKGTGETDSPAEGTGFEPSVPRDTISFRCRLMSLMLGSMHAEKSTRTITDTTRMPGASRGTDGSNPLPSSRQSVSRGIFASCIEKPAVAAGRAGPTRWYGRQRRARLVNITSTAGNISVGPYSSTAVPPAGLETVTTTAHSKWVASGRADVGWALSRIGLM
jgi:hypothetical protein